MRRLVKFLRHGLFRKNVRLEMTSRINKVTITSEGYVRKQAGNPFSRGEHQYDPVLLIRREAEFLKLLDGKRTPRLLSEGDDWIVMTHCGSELSRNNLPVDWRGQIDEIASILNAARVIHRDIKPGNILVHDGKLILIDFGWAIATGEEPYVCPRDLCTDVPREYIYDNLAALRSAISLYAK